MTSLMRNCALAAILVATGCAQQNEEKRVVARHEVDEATTDTVTAAPTATPTATTDANVATESAPPDADIETAVEETAPPTAESTASGNADSVRVETRKPVVDAQAGAKEVAEPADSSTPASESPEAVEETTSPPASPDKTPAEVSSETPDPPVNEPVQTQTPAETSALQPGQNTETAPPAATVTEPEPASPSPAKPADDRSSAEKTAPAEPTESVASNDSNPAVTLAKVQQELREANAALKRLMLERERENFARDFRQELNDTDQKFAAIRQRMEQRKQLYDRVVKLRAEIGQQLESAINAPGEEWAASREQLTENWSKLRAAYAQLMKLEHHTEAAQQTPASTTESDSESAATQQDEPLDPASIP